MDITPSSTQVSGVETCVRALLSPSAFPHQDACCSACIAAIGQLIKQDRASQSSSDRSPLYNAWDKERQAPMRNPASFWKLDVGCQIRLREFGLEVLHLSLLFPRPATGLDPPGPDHGPPGGLLQRRPERSDAAAPMPAAAVACHGCREYASTPLGPGLVLLRALLPAFQAEMRTTLHFDPQRSELAKLFGLIADAVLICDPIPYEKAALTELLPATPEPAALCEEMRRLEAGLLTQRRRKLGRDVEKTSHWSGEVRAGDRCSCLGGCLPGAMAPSTDPVLLISLKRRRVEPSSTGIGRKGLGLTKREADVARLLAERRSNLEIAAALCISPHTARHHTEQVLVKLGLHSRAGVWGRLGRER